MFNRRLKPTVGRKTLNLFWPSIGWRRAGRYMLHRLGRMPGTPYSIAAGFACGAAVSFTPFVGLHFILGGVLAWIIRANIVASAIGTAIGNPWTFPFIWVWIYEVGQWLNPHGEMKAHEEVLNLNFAGTFGKMMEASLQGDFAMVGDIAAPVFLPMLIGSAPTTIFVWVVFYFPLKKVVERYQRRRRKSVERKQAATPNAREA